MSDLAEFHRGQKYQLLIDFYPIPYKSLRSDAIRCYIDKLSKDEIDEHIRALYEDKLPVYSIKSNAPNPNICSIKTYRFYKKKCDFYTGDNLEDDFYLGRCYQYLLDTTNKPVDDTADITTLAQTSWGTILCKRELRSTIYYDNKYCDCGEYYPDDTRCACGNVKLVLDYDEYAHLDDSTIYISVERY